MSYQDLPPHLRSRWIVQHRATRGTLDVHRPHDWFVELERSAHGPPLPTLTVLLRSRECPWHCLMCDLWQFTSAHPVPPGAVPAQLSIALDASANAHPGPVRQIKLYNSGSFFDAGAIPPTDYPVIARRLAGFERVIVECHPKLINRRAPRFRDLLAGHPGVPAAEPQLEIAMGLETVHPLALERLNKGMTLDDFRRAASFLLDHRIALRAFVLVQPPFVPSTETVEWTTRSIAFAFDCGATVVSLIPTRPGNGALDALITAGEFSPPNLRTLEEALDRGVALGRGRVFADLWDLERFSGCTSCFPARHSRLESTNLGQTQFAAIHCPVCGNGF